MADRIVEVRDGGVQSFAGGCSDWIERAS